MKLTTKISLVLVLIVLLTGAMIGILSIDNIIDVFDDYLYRAYEIALQEWAKTFVAFYSYNGGSWDGVENLGQLTANFYQAGNVVLSDLDGRILYHYDRSYLGMQVPPDIFKRGYVLRMDGERIGILYPAALFSSSFTQLEQDFAHSAMSAVLKGVLFTSLFAIILGLGLSMGISRPLRDLTLATKRMSRGNFEEPLPIYSTDEIGDLARSFNTMAQELEKSRDLRSQMVADISHELRTPLTVLGSKMELALDQNKPLEAEDIAVLYDEVIRLQGMVGELQDLSKLETGHAMLDKTLIPFRDFFADLQMLLEAEAESRQIDLEVQLDEAPEYCYADPKRLKQIMLNLINNAFRYTPEGGRVTIEARQEGNDFLFSVRDTGIGIAPDEVDKIFERFYRTDRSRQRESGGSGLGLAITKALVEAHGGEITVESVLDQGTVFTVRLPGWDETSDLDAARA